MVPGSTPDKFSFTCGDYSIRVSQPVIFGLCFVTLYLIVVILISFEPSRDTAMDGLTFVYTPIYSHLQFTL